MTSRAQLSSVLPLQILFHHVCHERYWTLIFSEQKCVGSLQWLVFFCLSSETPQNPGSISLSQSVPLPPPQTRHIGGREGGSSVYRSSHHLWNFRARPRWKGVLCPPDEECPCVVSQRKGFILPGIWRHLEKSNGDFPGGWVGGYGKLDRRRMVFGAQALILLIYHRLKSFTWKTKVFLRLFLWSFISFLNDKVIQNQLIKKLLHIQMYNNFD